MTIAPDRTGTSLDTAVEKATARLLELQHPDGWWVGELESNATRRIGPGRGGGFVCPGRAPISCRSIAAGRTGLSAWTTESGTTVWRAQQEKL